MIFQYGGLYGDLAEESFTLVSAEVLPELQRL
jgi:hypothetical protein